MATQQYDTIILGSGPSGNKLAQLLATEGKNVALIERDRFGGVCPNRGCFPKKMLVTRSATVLATRGSNENYFSPGGGSLQLNFPALTKDVQTKLERMDSKHQESFEKKGIVCIRGEGQLIGPGQVVVGDTELHAKHIVIATGGRPRPLGCEGEELAVNSDRFFELEDLPEDLLFIGGGYISLEFATVALAAGKKVRVLTRGDHLLSQYDSRLTNLLRKQYESLGVTFITNDTVQKIEAAAEQYQVTCNSGTVLTADMVISATGRVPNLSGLNLQAVSDVFAGDGFRPNVLQYQTPNDTHTYFIGDLVVEPELPFTTQAHKEAAVVAEFILSGTPVDRDSIAVSAQSVFTYPELAFVSNETKLKNAENVTEIFIDSLGLGTYYAIDHSGVLVKYDKESGEIYSVGVLAPYAGEFISAYAMLIEENVSIYTLDKEIAAFPTIARSAIGSIAAKR